MGNEYQAPHDRLLQEMSIILQKDGFKTEPSDDECYMLLADFNGVVFAGHPTRLGVQFVTGIGTMTDKEYHRDIISPTAILVQRKILRCAVV